jgi:DNA-binding CsgD family transcriptional regulator
VKNRPPRLGPPPDLEGREFSVAGSRVVLLEWTQSPASSSPRQLHLTPAERDVLSLLLLGKSDVAIAKARSKSARTVANQIAGLFRKFEVHSRAELAAKVALLQDLSKKVPG